MCGKRINFSGAGRHLDLVSIRSPVCRRYRDHFYNVKSSIKSIYILEL